MSNLQIPGFEQPWEKPYGKPERIVTALDIMIEGPLGGAAFNNEFGRPALTGYFRTFEQSINTPTAKKCAATTSRSCSPAAWATSAKAMCRRARSPSAPS
ncbi:hypothetical protein NWF32_30825 [Pseudomonas qingdaonensis]|nr:hypothetical protein [Pseudomonas qingdaonensis]